MPGGQKRLVFKVVQIRADFDGREEGVESQVRGIVVFGEVGQKDIFQFIGSTTADQFAGHDIGEVALFPSHPFFEHRGIDTVPQHIFVVVGFEENQVRIFHRVFDVGAGIAHIGNDADFFFLEVETKKNGVRGVMAFGEGMDFRIADPDGIRVFYKTKKLFVEVEMGKLEGFFRYIDWNRIFFNQDIETLDVVDVFMGNKNGFDLVDMALNLFQSRTNLFATDPCIHQETVFTGFNKESIPVRSAG